MRAVNIHHAKNNLSRLVDEAFNGDSFVIAKAGKPMVLVSPLQPGIPQSRIGFMKGKMTIPDDIKAPWSEEIDTLFLGDL